MKHPIATADRPDGAHRVLAVLAALVVLVTCLAGLGPGPHGVAHAAEPKFTGTITKVGVDPGGAQIFAGALATGADHNLWLTVVGEAAIVRLTTAGIATRFTTGITPGVQGEGITAGPDGNMWFTEGAADTIGRITPNGTVTEFSVGITSGAHPVQIVTGPDGNLWFSERGRAAIGRITPQGTVTEFTTGLTYSTRSVTVGPDGNLWFGGWQQPFVAKVTTAGVITVFQTYGVPGGITAGPDGRIYVVTRAHPNTNGHAGVESLSTAGAQLPLKSLEGYDERPDDMVTGPDGALWISFGDPNFATDNVIMRMTIQGVIQSFGVNQKSNMPSTLTIGPDGDLWTSVALKGNVTRFSFAAAPSAPTGVSATSTGDAQVTLHWTAPASDPEAPTTGFHVTPYENGVAQPVRNFDASTTTRVITGLTNGASITFRVTATNAIGSSNPSTPSAPVTPRHFSEQEAFVRAAYQDFISRPPTTPELDTWVPYLTSGGSRSSLVTQLAASPEWVSTIVTRFYTDTLGRSPDPTGLAYWNGLINTGKLSVASVASRLYASNEYYTHFGGGTPRTWVSDLYTKILRRPAANDQAGVAYWVNMVTSRGRSSVAYSFYQSPESRMDRVDALYEALLHRHAETGGQQYWADIIYTSGDVALAKNLSLSPEYYANAATRFP